VPGTGLGAENIARTKSHIAGAFTKPPAEQKEAYRIADIHGGK
jgi:hypothetical protein